MNRILSFAAACVSVMSKIIEFNDETIPIEHIDRVEFAVINFYDNSETSKAINMVFE